jgi:phage shock protein A
MNDKKGWGATVLGWFVVSDDEEGRAAEGGDASGERASEMPQVFVKDPPAAMGGQVDFKAVFEAAGIDEEQAGRVARAQELLASLPGETPAPVKKQIVEASLTAFGVSIDRIIEAASPKSRPSKGTSAPGRRHPTLLAESAAPSRSSRTKSSGSARSWSSGAERRPSRRPATTSWAFSRSWSSSGRKRSHASCRPRRRAAPRRVARPDRWLATRGDGMAGGGLFTRLGNLWRGFLSLWISDVEKQHPEIAYENAINSMIAKFSKLKTATAAIIRRREDIDARNGKAKSDLAEVEGQLAAALDTSQDDLAVVLIQKKNALEKELAELRDELNLAQKDADSAKSSLITVQSEIKKLKAERDSMLAKMQSAQARIKIQEQLDGLSVDAEVKALDNVRDHIKTTIAEANLGRELSESSLDSRLEALRNQAGDVQARQQLAEMKAKRVAQQAAQVRRHSNGTGSTAGVENGREPREYA